MKNNIMVFRQELQETNNLVLSCKKGWNKIYVPDQELILFKISSSTHSTHYLLDSETLYLLDDIILFEGDASL